MAINTFADNGQAGTLKNFFANAMTTRPDDSFEEIYGDLAPVIARQFVNVPDTPINPLTQNFIGEALQYGSVIQDIFIDPIAMRATKTKKTDLGDPTDELGFADVGMKVTYATINAKNTSKVSRFMYEINKASIDVNVAGSLGEGIIEGLRVGQVACLENQMNKVLVSSMPATCNAYCNVAAGDDGATQIKKERAKIIDVAMKMAKVNTSFVASGYAGGAARDIAVIAPREKWADLILDKSGIFHPEYLEFEQFKKLGVNLKPIMVDGFETPVTTTEASDYETYSGITWDNAPGLGAAKPDYIVCDMRYLRCNPFIDRYMMYTKPVVANEPYMNFFLHMQNAISYQPSRKAARIYSGEGTDGQ